MSAEYPNIRDFKPFFIQTQEDETAINIAEEYGLIVKTYPITDLPNMKEPANNEWFDEDGDDEYLDRTHFEAMEYEILFYIRTSDNSTHSAMEVLLAQKRAFFDKIRKGEFRFYDEYWKFGRQKVRYVSSVEESKSRGDNWVRQIFKITFKINDPLTEMELQWGKIQPKTSIMPDNNTNTE